MALPRTDVAPGPTGEDPRHHTASWYAHSAGAAPLATPLDGAATADLCVIGGGLAGLGAALAAARAGRSVRLIEAGPIGWGASGRNGGQVHPGWQHDQTWFEARLGLDGARAVWRAGEAARSHFDTLLALDPARCDYRAGLIHAEHRAEGVAAAHAHVRHMHDVYCDDSLEPLDREAMRAAVDSEGYHGGYLNRRGGHCHPLKLVHAMARAAQAAGARLHPHTRCTALARTHDGWSVETPLGAIAAGAVIDATGAYARRLVPASDARVLPINNYVATTAPLDPALAARLIRDGAAVADSRFVVYYFRVTPDHRLLFGGGESYGWRMPRDIAAMVRPHILRVFPRLADVPISHAWGGTLAISRMRLPFALEPAPGLIAINGFSGTGLVLAPWLGDLAGRAALGERSAEWDLVRRLPAPRFPGGALLRWPAQAVAMRIMALGDRLRG